VDRARRRLRGGLPHVFRALPPAGSRRTTSWPVWALCQIASAMRRASAQSERLAWCGLTETQAKAEKRQVEIARFPWAASGRAATLGRTDGLTKLIFEPDTHRLLGMGLVGPGVGEMIAEGVLAVEMAAVAEDIADSIHPHPTLSETVGESAEALFGLATHLFRPRR